MKACNSCGKCCIKYGDGGIAASEQDLELWAVFRPHIDRFVRKGELWFDPVSGNRLTSCPWLKKLEGKNQYHCEIYHDRPEDCRLYPSSVEEMVRDDCEMIETRDLTNLELAQKSLAKLMA